MKFNYKAVLKSLLPFVCTLLAVGVQYGVTGEFDKAEVATAITGIGASLVTLLTPNDTNADQELDKTPITVPTGNAPSNVQQTRL
jgi:hypothetical protein